MGRNIQPTPEWSATVFLPSISNTPTGAYTPAQSDHSAMFKIQTQLLHCNRWPSSISNTLRQVRIRQKPSRISPVPHPSPPSWVTSPHMMEKTKMGALNGYKDVRRLASTLATTSDQHCCKDPHKMWQKSYIPWMKTFHMTN